MNPSNARCFLQKHFYIHIKTPHGTASAWWVFWLNNLRSKLIHSDFLHSPKHFKDSNELQDISLFPLVYYNALTAVRSCHSNKVVSVFMNWNISPGFPFWEIQISICKSSLRGRDKRFPILNSLLGKHLLFQTGESRHEELPVSPQKSPPGYWMIILCLRSHSWGSHLTTKGKPALKVKPLPKLSPPWPRLSICGIYS